MGVLDKILGRKPDYPPLDRESDTAKRLERVSSELGTLAENVTEDIEVVPSEEETYVFLGKPPKEFGLAWIRQGQVKNLKNALDELDVPHHKAEAIVEQIRAAYERSEDDERYSTDLAGKTVVVTRSEGLERKVHEIVQKLAA